MEDASLLSNLTVPELQQECKRRGLKKSGIKKKLIQRLSDYIQKNGPDYIQPSDKVTSVQVGKVTPTIPNPHPYMEEYENQLIQSVGMETDVAVSNMFVTTTDVTTTDVTTTDVTTTDVTTSKTNKVKNVGYAEEVTDEIVRLPDENNKDVVCDKIDSGQNANVGNNDDDDDDVCGKEIGTEHIADVKENNEDVGVCQEEVEPEQNIEMDEEVEPNSHYDDETLRIMAYNDEQICERKDDENEGLCREMDTEADKDYEDENVENGMQELQYDQPEVSMEYEILNNEGIDHEDNKVNNEFNVTEEKTVEKEEEEDEKKDVEENEESVVDVNNMQDEIHDESRDIEEGEITTNIENMNESDGDNSFDTSMRENESEDTGLTTKLPKKNVVPVSLRRKSLVKLEESSEEKVSRRKRRWGSTSTSMKDSGISISSETIKKLIPDMKIDAAALESVPVFEEYHQEDGEIEEVKENILDAVATDVSASPPKINKPGRTVKVDSTKKVTCDVFPSQNEDMMTVTSDQEDLPTESVPNYEIDDVTTHSESAPHSSTHSIQNEEVDVATACVATTPSTPALHAPTQSVQNYEIDEEVEVKDEREKSPSPARNPPSQYIHINNLVRPYTIRQLKSVIQRTGRICDGGFWINNIKSQCYAKLSSESEAAATRDALHGLCWPVGSPKVLKIDFAINRQMYKETTGLLGEKPKVVIEIEDSENDLRNGGGKKRIPPKDSEKEKEKEKEKENKDNKSGVTPVKLLDDLFRKTKSTPCIYWLPLTDEQVVEREKHNQQGVKDGRDTVAMEQSNDHSSDRQSQQLRNTNRSL